MPAKPRPVGFAEFARQFGRKASREKYKIAHTTYDRWCAEVGISKRRIQTNLKAPEGFAEKAAKHNNPTLIVDYGVSKATIIRWRKEVGVSGNHREDMKKSCPDTFAMAARTMTLAQLSQRFGVSDFVLCRWKRELGIIGQPGKRAKPFTGYILNPAAKVQDNRPDSLVTRAQSHLQRIGPVWKRGDGFYVFGRQMTVDAMLSRAEALGFDPNEWKRVANADRV